MTSTFQRYLVSLFFLFLSATNVQQAAANELQLPQGDAPLKTTAAEQLGTRQDGVGIAVGQQVPNFTSATHKGETISLNQLLADAPLMVVFYRGGWCPYCNLQIRQLTESYNQFAAVGVEPVLVSVDKPDAAALAQRTYDIPFPVLSDPQLAAHEAFDVILAVDEKTVEQYREYGIDLQAWSGEDHHKIAVAGIFIVNQQGKVIWAHTDRDYTTRPNPQQLLAVIQALDM